VSVFRTEDALIQIEQDRAELITALSELLEAESWEDQCVAEAQAEALLARLDAR
jgi:hypothetical protein